MNINESIFLACDNLLTNQKTERLLRLLAAVGVIDEVAENTYRPNAVTHFMNQPGFIGGEKHQ